MIHRLHDDTNAKLHDLRLVHRTALHRTLGPFVVLSGAVAWLAAGLLALATALS